MNRRDLLKQTGAALLATSPLSAMTSPSYDPQPKTSCQDRPLVVTFLGPFCYWVNNNATSQEIIAMAAPVGPTFIVPHQPWMGTTSNETQIPWQTYPTLRLVGVQGATSVNYVGTEIFKYGQEPDACPGSLPPQNGSCVPPLFRLSMPLPDQIIGLNPACFDLEDNPNQKRASAVAFVYNNVNVPMVAVNCINNCPSKPFTYTPDFSNDKTLPVMNLGIHVTPEVRPDPHHEHANLVLNQMFAMCPWISSDDISLCQIRAVAVGSGNDCSEPSMLLDAGGPLRRKYKPRGAKK